MPRKKTARASSSVKHFNATVITWLIFVLILEVCIMLGIQSYLQMPKKVIFTPATSFDDCAAIGYPVMESYPRQCRDLTYGKTFTEVLQEKNTYVNATKDDIVVMLPFSGAVTGKEFSIIGKARGTWFFEGSAPYEVLDKDGKTLASGLVEVGEAWMNTDFTSFETVVKIPETYIGEATIILKKDNPSGLSEKEASVSIPVTIEY